MFRKIKLLTFSLLLAVSTHGQGHAQTIETSLANARIHSPVIKAAILEIDAAKEIRLQALSGWKPTVNAQLSIFSTDISSSNFSQGNGATTKDGNLAVDQPLYRGGRTVAETKRADVVGKIAASELQRITNVVLLQTALSHIDIIRNALLLRNAMNSRLRAEEELKATQYRMAAGEMTQTDLNQASARVSQTLALVSARQGALERSQARYARLTGSPVPVALPFPSLPMALPATLSAAVAATDVHNPEIEQARLSREAAKQDVDIAASDLRPKLNAYASLIKQYDPQPGIIDDAEERQIGLRAAIPLYEGGLIRSRVRESRIRLNKTDFNIDDAAGIAEEQVMTNWIAMNASRATTTARLAEVSASTQALTGIRTEMLMGERSLLDVLQAQQELSDSEDAYIQSKCDELSSAYNLLASIGILDTATP